MVAWFIIAIATLAVFALIAVNGVQTVAATTDGVGRVETTRRVEAAVSAIIARTGSPNNTGKALVIAGSTVNGVYGLPAEMSALASTPFGQRIVYCPFGDGEAGTANADIPAGAGTTYPIQVKPDASGRIYVTSGRPSFPQVAENSNLMAFVIAPRTKTSGTPTCNSVRFNPNTNRFEAPDAIVRPVIRSAAAEDQRQQAGREVVFYVSNAGTGRGLTPTDTTSLYSALNYYRSAMPQAMRIIMATDAYVLPAQYMNATTGGYSDKGNSGTLVIEGNSSTLDFNGSSDIWMPANLEIRNLTIASNVGVWSEQGHKVTLVNTNTGYLRINNGGSLQATNISVTDTRLGWALYINDGSSAVLNGTIRVTSMPSQNGIVAAGGSKVMFENANIIVGASSGAVQYGIYNEDNTDLVIKGGSMSFLGTVTLPMLISGRTSIFSSSITMAVAPAAMFQLEGGSSLSINGGTYGLNATPGIAIAANGAISVSGTGVMRATSRCWSGTQFAQSAVGNGASSAVLPADTAPGMSAQPTAAEVQNNTNVNASNAQRAQLRNTNTSSFTCQM